MTKDIKPKNKPLRGPIVTIMIAFKVQEPRERSNKKKEVMLRIQANITTKSQCNSQAPFPFTYTQTMIYT